MTSDIDEYEDDFTVSVGVDSKAGNRSKQTTAEGELSEALPTAAYQGKSDNRSIGGVEQSGVKGAKRPEMKRYSVHSQDRGPRARRLAFTQSEPTLTSLPDFDSNPDEEFAYEDEGYGRGDD